MFTNILRNLSTGRFGAPAPRPYRKVGGGFLLPVLAFLGWKYRDQIKSFVRDKLQLAQGGATNLGPEAQDAKGIGRA